MLLGTASKLARTFKCPASNLLPQADQPPLADNDPARRGIGIHAYLELVPLCKGQQLIGFEGDLPWAEWEEFCEQINLTHVAGSYTPPHLREISFAYHPETGECREVISYEEVEEDWITGTADVVVVGYGFFEVYDYKTGSRAPKARGNEQLMFLALCTQKLLCPMATRGVIGIQHITKDAKVKTDATIVDVLELEMFEDQLRARMKEAKELDKLIQMGKTPPVEVGEHCRWCDAKAHCPAFQDKDL